MAIKSVVKLFILLSVIQGYKFQTSLPGEPCTAEEISAISTAQQERYNNAVDQASSTIEQKIDDAENNIGKPDETAEKNIRVIRESIETLKQDICTKAQQLQVDVKLAKLDASQLKCAANAEKSKTSIIFKARSDLLKLQNTKLKIPFALRKCGSPKVVGDCSVVEACSKQVVDVLLVKLDSLVAKVGASIDKAIFEQGDCLSKVVIQALNIQAEVKRILLQCKLQEPSKPSEEEPSKPSEEEPSKPSEEEPSKPSEEEPSKPSEEEPSKPSEEKPAEPNNPQSNESNEGSPDPGNPGNGEEQQGSNQSGGGEAPATTDEPNRSVEGSNGAAENTSNGGEPEESNNVQQE